MPQDSNFNIQNSYQINTNNSGGYYNAPSDAWKIAVSPNYQKLSNQRVIYDEAGKAHSFYQDIPTSRWVSIEKPSLQITDQQLYSIIDGTSKLNFQDEFIEYKNKDGERYATQLTPNEYPQEFYSDDYLPEKMPWVQSKKDQWGYRDPVYPALFALAIDVEKVCALARK